MREMTVKELIDALQKQNPKKVVYIEQNGPYAYMSAQTVKEKNLNDANDDEEAEFRAVVIEFK